jgi:hypothetical protein
MREVALIQQELSRIVEAVEQLGTGQREKESNSQVGDTNPANLSQKR